MTYYYAYCASHGGKIGSSSTDKFVAKATLNAHLSGGGFHQNAYVKQVIKSRRNNKFQYRYTKLKS